MSDYYSRIQKTLEYIESNIKDEISLDKLAQMCFYSSHHFHRIFQSIVGIPISDYIRKRKLAVIANEIIETDKKILDIATEYGFNSHETFTRAFKRTFDITPTAYRKLNTHAIPINFWKVSFANSDLQKKYMKAVERLCNRLKQDKNILAVIISGSLSYDQVWEKSDIDISIIVNDGCKLKSEICLLEEDIYVDGHVITRSDFKGLLNKSLKSSFFYSYYSLSTMIYCKDESIRELFEEISNNDNSPEKDKSVMLMNNIAYILCRIYKAEKWLKVKSDVRYAYLWITEALRYIASIEVIMNDGVPSREVILQALKYKNPLIDKLYIGLMDQKKNSINISQAIDMIYAYLRENVEVICKTVLDYFDSTNKMKPLSMIAQDFKNALNANVICEVCEWLCDEGILVKDMSEIRITKKGNTIVYEPAYFLSNKDIDIFL
ncbi:AraC family transcriptional regulator [Clostridiaceae bacterium M8S5]|nr:AraC family transcriptional regulator [Clostridiaceae bacterium M8S5]